MKNSGTGKRFFCTSLITKKQAWSLGGRLYGDFGVSVGDVVTAVNYGRGELTEDGTGFIRTEDGDMPYEAYPELKAVCRANARVAGIITADLTEDPYVGLLGSNYYSVIASDAFAKRLTEADRDGIEFEDGTWSNQEYGYTRTAVYTGMDAEYLSTDYLMARSAAEHGLEFTNDRERNTAYRQEAIQALLHIWICGICIFLILMLIQLNIETLHGLSETLLCAAAGRRDVPEAASDTPCGKRASGERAFLPDGACGIFPVFCDKAHRHIPQVCGGI